MEPHNTTSSTAGRLIILSNRLPFVLFQNAEGWQVRPSPGGLVTALGPVLRNRGGMWIGWPGAAGKLHAWKTLLQRTRGIGYRIAPVHLSQSELRDYYYGFANEIIWPLFHCQPSRCNFHLHYWQRYRQVNQKFASVVHKHTQAQDYIWVHDYHLMQVAAHLRALQVGSALGFFLHIPFPPPHLFQQLPWRREVLEGLLAYDLLGFQIEQHRNHFIQCVKIRLPEARVKAHKEYLLVHMGNRTTRVQHFPIGIDYETFAQSANTPQVDERQQEILHATDGRTLILGLDRMDYTKGIPQRLEAIRTLFLRYPALRTRITFVQVAVPSRMEVPAYAQLRHEVEQQVGEINGQFTAPGWVPIHYLFRSLSRQELLAYYRSAQIALLTPLDDGMNLVAKEFCACSCEKPGVLILSEFAGAAAQLAPHALIVNPYDVEGTAQAIYLAYRMPRKERALRMSALQAIVRKENVFHWVSSFLRAGLARDLDAYPVTERPSVEEDTGHWWEGA